MRRSAQERPKHILLIGYGSMGTRRHALLQHLRPAWKITIYDPFIFPTRPMPAGNSIDAAIIASPYPYHADAVTWCATAGTQPIPCLVEKPLAMEVLPAAYSHQSVMGFNYRFHRQWEDIQRLAAGGDLVFTAYENLYAKYGATVAATAGSHAFDMAIQLLGPVEQSCVESNGVQMWGWMGHAHGRSVYDYDMNYQGRFVSIDDGKAHLLELARDDECYMREMEAWISVLETGARHPRLASLEEGLAVDSVIRQTGEWYDVSPM